MIRTDREARQRKRIAGGLQTGARRSVQTAGSCRSPCLRVILIAMEVPIPAPLLAAAARAAAAAEAADEAPLSSAEYAAGLADGRRVARWYIGGGVPVAGYHEDLLGRDDYRRGLRHGQAFEYDRAVVAKAMAAGDLCPWCGAAGGVSEHAPGCRFHS